MHLKPPLALVAILALLALHDLCVAEDAKQSLPQNAKQNSTQIVMEEVEEYTTPTLESEVDEPISEAELQRSKKDDNYEKKDEYEDKHGGKYRDKHDYEDKLSYEYKRQYEDKPYDKHDYEYKRQYEDKPYDKPSYEYKRQYDYEPDYSDGGDEYYKTTENYKDRYEYKYHPQRGYGRPRYHYVHRPPSPPTGGCLRTAPPLCENPVNNGAGYGSYSKSKCTTESGAIFAWSPVCTATNIAEGATCAGVAFCQPGNGAAAAVATCTSSGWTVTDECEPTGCSALPTVPNATFSSSTCSVPGFLNQVCSPTCSGGQTWLNNAICTASGWDVTGCCRATNFDIYNLGSIDLQYGWTSGRDFVPVHCNQLDFWDEGIKVDPTTGRRVWRISNANVTGNWGRMPYSYTACQVAGETGAELWNFRAACGQPLTPGAVAVTNRFFWRATFRSATGGAQPGLRITLSAAAKMEDSRNTYLRIDDTGSGYNLFFIDTSVNGVFNPEVTIATNLAYAGPHILLTTIEYVDGLNVDGTGNDIVKVYLNGTLLYTGTTWETYWRTVQIGGQFNRTRAANSMLFRPSGVPTALVGVAANYLNGFYFEDVTVGNVP